MVDSQANRPRGSGEAGRTLRGDDGFATLAIIAKTAMARTCRISLTVHSEYTTPTGGAISMHVCAHLTAVRSCILCQKLLESWIVSRCQLDDLQIRCQIEEQALIRRSNDRPSNDKRLVYLVGCDIERYLVLVQQLYPWHAASSQSASASDEMHGRPQRHGHFCHAFEVVHFARL